MNESAGHSEWRIDLSRRLAAFYSCRPQVEMIDLGGSPSRGISEEFSDLAKMAEGIRL